MHRPQLARRGHHGLDARGERIVPRDGRDARALLEVGENGDHAAVARGALFSKEGAAQLRPKVGLENDSNGHNFAFTSPPPLALTERETFKAQLMIISNDRAARNTGAVSKRPLLPPTVVFVAPPPSLPALQTLITETEFWEGREQLLLAQAASDSQKKGRPGQLVDPRPQAVEGGEVKIVITPQLVHDIFDEYPVVAKAYDENVPSKLSEAEFWKRYFQSKLFHSHRASIRSTAAQHVVKDDAIFDKYLERPDDELEPRRPRDDEVDMFIDLEATREDHEETGNERDVTMQAGKQRGALPLIRKFNEHSERLLKSAISNDGTSKRRRLDSGDASDSGGHYSQIDLADLHNPEPSSGVLLEMQDRQRYFESRAGAAASAEQAPRPTMDLRAAWQQMRRDLDGWQGRLAQLKTDRKAAEAALASMTENVATRLDAQKRKADIPEEIFGQMRTCQTAANEFLRQFWSAIYPPVGESTLGGPTTLAQKTAKATRMAGYLTKTSEKVAAIVRAAEMAGVDRSRVQIGMQPTLDAAKRGLGFWGTRKAAPGARRA
ncbi:hypothetical protein EDB83DRAFT_2502723 [Lactarius deliciosus]|nr:hypothetical protein EDB83DRAFT_2502723 [Lactarius deliciosus]